MSKTTRSPKSSTEDKISPFIYTKHLLGALEEMLQEENIPDKDDPELDQWTVMVSDLNKQICDDILQTMQECAISKWSKE